MIYYYRDTESAVNMLVNIAQTHPAWDNWATREMLRDLLRERIRAVIYNGMLRDLRYDVDDECGISIYTHHQDFEAGDTPTNIVMRYELPGQDITHNFYLESDQ